MTDAFRLPHTVRPRRYDLMVRPDLDASTFSGTVRIALDVAEATDSIVLHARDLDVELGVIRQDGTIRPAGLRTEPDNERIVCELDHALTPGPAELELTFSGEISHGMLGFYRSTFVDDDGRERVLCATQFEAPHARAAFPCFDEPEFKAVFGVTLEVPDGLLALSNGPEIGREACGDGLVRVRYGDTISMSTYLVAWVVGPLALSAPVDAGGVAVRVADVPAKAHLTAFALDVASFAITYFADYYGIPYPGEKCDLVALPDFSFGAMENLGLITFRETRLLLDPAEVTLDEMAGAALDDRARGRPHVVRRPRDHEVVERHLAERGVRDVHGAPGQRRVLPEWRTWDDFAVGRAAALDVDALAHTRTVEYEVRSPADADGMFDLLTYQKGGSVLRMLERWLGADAFRAGVRGYLDRYQLSNTETTDLWDALEAATGEPVRRIMDSWIFQPGFPFDPARRRPASRSNASPTRSRR